MLTSYLCRSKLENPKVLAMVSIYNARDFIKNRLDNLFESTMIDDLHIYCFDANSPGKEYELIQKHMDYGNVTYVMSDARLSLYETWNYILKDTEGGAPYITNANCSDLVSPEYHQRMSDCLDKNERISLCYTDWYTTDAEIQRWDESVAMLSNVFTPSLENGEPTTCGHFPMWRRSLHTELGLFDEKFKIIGDVEWRNRLLSNNKKHGKIKGTWGCSFIKHNRGLFSAREGGSLIVDAEMNLIKSSLKNVAVNDLIEIYNSRKIENATVCYQQLQAFKVKYNNLMDYNFSVIDAAPSGSETSDIGPILLGLYLQLRKLIISELFNTSKNVDIENLELLLKAAKDIK